MKFERSYFFQMPRPPAVVTVHYAVNTITLNVKYMDVNNIFSAVTLMLRI